MSAASEGVAGFLILAIAGLLLPLGTAGWWFEHPLPLALAGLVLAAGIWCHASPKRDLLAGLLIAAAVLLGSLAPLLLVLREGPIGAHGIGLWIFLLALFLLAWRAMAILAGQETSDRRRQALARLLVPLLFGIGLLYVWELTVRAFDVPRVLLPAPSAIALALVHNVPMLWADFRQTFLKAVIPGWIMGCGSGFLVAVLVDRVPFLQRGLLPFGNLVSALPIIGVAPIMVMWFGFGWESKAAVVVVMTFFPMLVNTVTGLASAGRIELDLMRSYAAGYTTTLLKLRLPAALPFVFNALKINSTLALIGAIVAEFFGTPIVGMGFRISTEVARMDLDIVWATIAVAAVAGSLFYALLAAMERGLTFWHPSYRS
jgi:NitT/TauT family transport system permease protein